MAMLFLAATTFAAKKYTLVIDAGHGGKDTGAPGTFSKEKDINLRVALAFGRLVEQNCRDVRVIYTRKTDVFVTLNGRADIANRNKADLFISIHTNALESRKQISGMETYTLGNGRSNGKATNLDVAKRENSVIVMEKDYKQHYAGYDPNSPESNIMFEFVQDQNLASSVDLAKKIQRYGTRAAKRPDKGVHQANLLVLRCTSMPGCLVELGYISTKEEERLMNTSTFVSNIARGLYNAFVEYKQKYDKGNTIRYVKYGDDENQNAVSDKALASNTTTTKPATSQTTVSYPQTTTTYTQTSTTNPQSSYTSESSSSQVPAKAAQKRSRTGNGSSTSARTVTPVPVGQTAQSKVEPVSAVSNVATMPKMQTPVASTQKTTTTTTQPAKQVAQTTSQTVTKTTQSATQPAKQTVQTVAAQTEAAADAVNTLTAKSSQTTTATSTSQAQTSTSTSQAQTSTSQTTTTATQTPATKTAVTTQTQQSSALASESKPQISTVAALPTESKAQSTASTTKPAETKAQSTTQPSDAKALAATSAATTATTTTTPSAAIKAETPASSNNTAAPASSTKATALASSAKATTPASSAKSDATTADTDGYPVFKVQFLTSGSKLPEGSPRFKGLSDVDSYIDNGVYKYTAGSSVDYTKIARLKKTVAAKFPDAFIIAFKNGKRTDIHEAIQEYKKNPRKVE